MDEDLAGGDIGRIGAARHLKLNPHSDQQANSCSQVSLTLPNGRKQLKAQRGSQLKKRLLQKSHPNKVNSQTTKRADKVAAYMSAPASEA